MDVKLIGKELLGCVDVEKAGEIIIEKVGLAALKKVVDDSANKFDDAAYAMLAPLFAAKIKEVLKELAEKAKA